MIESSALLLTFTDQHGWGLARHKALGLHCTTDVDDNWYGSLSHVCSRVIRFDLFQSANASGVCQTNREILELAEVYRPEYVVYPCNFSGIVTEATLARLRAMGSLVIGFFFDEEFYFEKHTRWLVPFLDYCVTHVPKVLSRYEELGGRGILATHALPHNPALYRKITDAPKTFDVSFVGNCFPHRQRFLDALRAYGISVATFGGEREKKVSHARMVQIINQTRINLNFSTSGASASSEHKQIKGRVFEVPLCGGFLLTETTPALQNYFEVGKEMVTFHSVPEAAERIRYFLAHESEREEIAARGHARAQREYTGPVVLRNVFLQIEKDLRARGRPKPASSPFGLNTLRHNDAESHFQWSKALLSTAPPLRNAWRETAELVLQSNPGHVGALRLLRRHRWWGDPQGPWGHVKRSAWMLKDRVVRSQEWLQPRFKWPKVQERLNRLLAASVAVVWGRIPMSVSRARRLQRLVGHGTDFDQNPLHLGSARATHRLRNQGLSLLLQDTSLGGWALTADVINHIEQKLSERRPEAILEFGCGTSTVCLAHFMKEIHGATGPPRVFSIEQDSSQAEATRSRLARFGLAGLVGILNAPVGLQRIDGEDTVCYQLTHVVLASWLGEARPDFVLVDGPAGDEDCRYGTLLMALPFLKPGAEFVLDDALRPGELRVAQRWSTNPAIHVRGVLWIGRGLLVGSVVTVPPRSQA